jgi:hypothetical protein
MKKLEAGQSGTMTGTAAALAPADAGDDTATAETRDRTVAPTRELAQRFSGMVEVRLLWHPEIDLVELSVHDPATDVSFHIEVAPGDANDAFNHPYAYAAKRTTTGRQGATSVPAGK